jgi:Mrp family chromosome partitioning ATPase/uncharacterized protein involved in exopolysaccharide biosynthesis
MSENSMQKNEFNGDPAPQANPVEMIRDRLAGRWLTAGILGLTLGVLGAFLAWNMTPLFYKSSGLLIASSNRAIVVKMLQEDGTNAKSHASYLLTQVSLVTSDDVVSRAIDSEQMQDLQRARGYYPLYTSIRKNLMSMNTKGTELIEVLYQDKDPEAASIVTNAVMNAYMEIHGNEKSLAISDTKKQIRDERLKIRNKINGLRRQQQELVTNSNNVVSDVSGLIASKAEECTVYNRAIEQIDETLAKIEARQKLLNEKITGDEIPEPTKQELMIFEPRINGLQVDLEQQEIKLATLRSRLGKEHRIIRNLSSQIEATKNTLESLKVEAGVRWKTGEVGKQKSYKNQIELKQKINKKLDTRRKDMRDLQNFQNEYDALDRDIDSNELDGAVLDERLTDLEREEPNIQDQVRIGQAATVPDSPDKDRRAPIAIGAFAGAIVLVLGVFFLIGSVDQRTFAIRQLKMDHGQFHCLGVVPDTSKASSEPEILNIGMNCVHKLRNRIESIRFRKPDTGYIMLISSPFQGDGKTTLVQLLGHSYAAAGFRTCLVDCDFIGRSLSHSLNMLDKRGLKEVVKEGALDDKLVELDRDNLFLLPIGLDEMVNPEMMQIDVVEELFAELRGKFDFIIIDTGPLSGSIESMPIAGSVDGVILALRKGRSRVPLKRCVRDLHQLNAPYLGVVLNYADKSDYKDIASVSKSIEQVIEEEATGVRKRNALTESLNNKSKRSRS